MEDNIKLIKYIHHGRQRFLDFIMKKALLNFACRWRRLSNILLRIFNSISWLRTGSVCLIFTFGSLGFLLRLFCLPFEQHGNVSDRILFWIFSIMCCFIALSDAVQSRFLLESSVHNNIVCLDLLFSCVTSFDRCCSRLHSGNGCSLPSRSRSVLAFSSNCWK